MVPVTMGRVVLIASSEAFGIGFLVTAFLFGFRHGIDWDHIAAITDITGSQDDRSQAFAFGTLYALGHALVVLVIGVAAIGLGERLPPVSTT
jgi:high-affinity nickel-transport protein